MVVVNERNGTVDFSIRRTGDFVDHFLPDQVPNRHGTTNAAALECGASANAATKAIFEALVSDEESHYDQFERQRDNITRFDLSYLALQSFGAGPSRRWLSATDPRRLRLNLLHNIVLWVPGTQPEFEKRVRKALASVDPNLVLYGGDPYRNVVI